jgi:hypothetical protein
MRWPATFCKGESTGKEVPGRRDVACEAIAHRAAAGNPSAEAERRKERSHQVFRHQDPFFALARRRCHFLPLQSSLASEKGMAAAAAGLDAAPRRAMGGGGAGFCVGSGAGCRVSEGRRRRRRRQEIATEET